MNNKLLAIHGGEPVFPNGPPNWPRATPEIVESVNLALKTDQWGLYEGEMTHRLTESLASFFGLKHILLCSSGTIAVELALRCAGVKPDDEVILAAYDFAGNFRAVETIGARPVLVDVLKNGWTIDPDSITPALSEKTTAIIVSHLHGQVANIDAIRNVISNPQIKIVEDNCQSPGGTLNNKPLGSHGDIATLSFGGSKLLSAGRGGAVLTDDEQFWQRGRIFAHRGNDAFPLSQLQAAALLPQLVTLPKHTDVRQGNAIQLIDETRTIQGLIGLEQVCPHVTPGYYKLPWILDQPKSRISREDFIPAIQAEGVAMDSGFRGFHQRSQRRCRRVGTLANAKLAAEQTLILHHPVLLESAETTSLVAKTIHKVFNALSCAE